MQIVRSPEQIKAIRMILSSTETASLSRNKNRAKIVCSVQRIDRNHARAMTRVITLEQIVKIPSGRHGRKDLHEVELEQNCYKL